MNLVRALLTPLCVLMVAACSEPEAPAFPSGDDAGLEAPLDFPLGESPEALVARAEMPPGSLTNRRREKG